MKYTKAYRERMGLSQQGLANELQVSLSAVKAWDQGTRKPSDQAWTLMRMLTRDTDHWYRATEYCRVRGLSVARNDQWIEAVEATR